MNARNLKYFNIAREVAKLSDYKKQHIGCVIVYKKQIISVGHNQCKTHTLQAIYNQFRDFKPRPQTHHFLHAEIDAIIKIRYLNLDWSKVEIYVYREHKSEGKLMMSKPCQACMNYIKDLGIRKIYYTINGDYVYEKLIK